MLWDINLHSKKASNLLSKCSHLLALGARPRPLVVHEGQRMVLQFDIRLPEEVALGAVSQGTGQWAWLMSSRV